MAARTAVRDRTFPNIGRGQPGRGAFGRNDRELDIGKITGFRVRATPRHWRLPVEKVRGDAFYDHVIEVRINARCDFRNLPRGLRMLRFHEKTFELIGVKPRRSPAALKLLAKRERECGVKFPPSVREF